MVAVYFAGSEDIDFTLAGGAISVAGGSKLRPAFAPNGINMATGTQDAATSAVAFAASTFWAQARWGNGFAVGNTNNFSFLELLDVSGIIRLRVVFASGGQPTTVRVEKVTALGVATTLFTTPSFTETSPSAGHESSPWSLHVNYTGGGGGFVELYYEGLLKGSFAGDPTTDGITSLSFIRLKSNGGGNNVVWSECIIGDFDTRACSLQTFRPVANGNTHNFDTGTPAAANVNEAALNVTTLDGSTTAGQIDEYTTGAVATGTFDVTAYGVSALMSKGTSGPSKADLAVRTGGADFFSADFVLGLFYVDYQNWWVTNPGTAAPWTTAQIGAAAGFNIGAKSVT